MKRKLSPADVVAIKTMLTDGDTQKKIAKKFGVSRSLVSDIATGRAHSEDKKPVIINKRGGQYSVGEAAEAQVLNYEAEIIHLKDERLQLKRQLKSAVKSHGLMEGMVEELEKVIKPYPKLPFTLPVERGIREDVITEHLVMHISDGHHDQVVTPDDTGGLETYNFPISMRRAEVYVDAVLKWTQQTLNPAFKFPALTILSYGDHTSGEIHGHTQRSYFRNVFKNSFAIGQLHALMVRDLAPYFENINVVAVPGNHGRRSMKKDYHGAHDNWDYMIAEIARLYCKDLDNVHFTIPNSFSINLDINGVGFCVFHGDDIRSQMGIPWYGLQRRQQRITALNSVQGGTRIRYNCCGHFHTPTSIGSMDGEMLVNGPWVATDAYAYNALGAFTEPTQLLHGVNSKYGITWRLPVRLRSDNEHRGPKRYKLEDASNIIVPA